MQDTWRATNHLTIDIGLRYEVQIPYLERYNRQAEQFNISAVNPASPQILANWAADAATYNATNPKYPYPTPPSAIYGVWQFAGQNGLPRADALYRLDQCRAAHRLRLSLGRQDCHPRRLRRLLSIGHKKQQFADRIQRNFAVSSRPSLAASIRRHASIRW